MPCCKHETEQYGECGDGDEREAQERVSATDPTACAEDYGLGAVEHCDGIVVDHLQKVPSWFHGGCVVPLVQFAERWEAGDAHPDHKVFVLAGVKDVVVRVAAAVTVLAGGTLPIGRRYDLVGVVLCFGILVLLSGPDDVLFAHDVCLIGRIRTGHVEQYGITERVVEHRVGDQSTWVDNLLRRRVHIDWFARSSGDGTVGDGVALQLIRVQRLDVASVVLVVVCELVVEKHAGIETCGDAKVEVAGSGGSVPRPGGRLEVRRVLVVQLVVVFGGRDLCLCGYGGCSGALGVVKAKLVDLLGKVVQNGTDGCEDDGDEEKGGQDGARSEDGLPCFQTLLLEGGIGRFTLGKFAETFGG